MSRSPRRTDEEYFRRPMRFFGFNRIIPFLRPYAKRLVLMAILAFIGTLFDIFIPQFQKYALDTYIGGETLSGFGRFVLIYVAFLLAQVAFNLVSILIAQRVELNINHDLRERCYRHR